jgi:hypothetical protein
VAHEGGYVGQSVEGVVENRFYLEGGCIEDQEKGGYFH